MYSRWSPMFPMTVACLVLCLFLLTGCAAPVCKAIPPLPSLNPRPVPEWQGKTYRDLLTYTVEVHESAEASEADKRAARMALGGK
jgi:hypothetical protein